MLWSLLQGYGAYGGDYTLDEMATVGTDCRPEDLLLDEIPPEIVGHFKALSFMNHTDVVFSYAALCLVTLLPTFLAVVCPPEYTSGAPTSAKWHRHIGQLLCSGIFCAVVVPREVKGIASYFGVLKATSPPTCRSIFNGKEFSRRCARPPSTNLPDVTRILAALSDLCSDSGPFLTITGDVRHMFHQIPISKEIGHYFALRFKDEDLKTIRKCAPSGAIPDEWCGMLRMRTVPMGFAYSPWVAQSIGFGLLIMALERAGVPGLDSWKTTRNPPSMIKLHKNGKLTLVCALWYDNLLVATADQALAHRILKEIKIVFDTMYHLKLKEIELLPARALRRNSPKKPTYLNIEFRTVLARAADGTERYSLEWCPVEKKRSKWETCVTLIANHMTARSISKVIGTVMWAHHIRLTPLCRLHDIIDVVRKAVSTATSTRSWKSPVVLTDTEVKLLKDGLRVSCAEEWSSQRPVADYSPMFVATDSSKRRWAYVTWQSREAAIDSSLCDASNWSTSMLESSIFLKELTCLTIAIERICARHHRRHLVCFVDNTAACHVARRLASSTHGGNELAVRIANALERAMCTVEIVHVASEHNPADTPTRQLRWAIQQQRVDCMWRVWDEYVKGRILEVDMSKYGRSFQAGIRHTEEDAGDSLQDSSSDDDDDVDDFDVFLAADSSSEPDEE
jgi:hypothetical protein